MSAHIIVALFFFHFFPHGGMTHIGDIEALINEWAPQMLAEAWDNVGLMTGERSGRVRRVLVTLDVTRHTLNRAGEVPDTLVIAHHPLIFKPLKTLSGRSHAASLVCDAIRRNIAVFVAHTNLDKVPGGVSSALAESIGLQNTTPLIANGEAVKLIVFVPEGHVDTVRDAASDAGAGVIGEYRSCSFAAPGTATFVPSEHAKPFSGTAGTMSREHELRLEMMVPSHLTARVVSAVRDVHPYEEMAYDLVQLLNQDSSIGDGIIGDLDAPMERGAFLGHIARCLQVDHVRASAECDSPVRRIAVLGGSGKDYIGAAIAAGVDAFVTGDLGHHDFIDYGDRFLLVDATHRGTELPVLDAVARKIRGTFKDVEIIVDPGPTPYEYVR